MESYWAVNGVHRSLTVLLCFSMKSIELVQCNLELMWHLLNLDNRRYYILVRLFRTSESWAHGSGSSDLYYASNEMDSNMNKRAMAWWLCFFFLAVQNWCACCALYVGSDNSNGIFCLTKGGSVWNSLFVPARSNFSASNLQHFLVLNKSSWWTPRLLQNTQRTTSPYF